VCSAAFRRRDFDAIKRSFDPAVWGWVSTAQVDRVCQRGHQRERVILDSSVECDSTLNRASKIPARKNPAVRKLRGLKKTWQHPTFTQPCAALSSGWRRLISVFGMGTDGSTFVSHQENFQCRCLFESSHSDTCAHDGRVAPDIDRTIKIKKLDQADG
jgi:hypothetical protein